jgi:hypothetical protein
MHLEIGMTDLEVVEQIAERTVRAFQDGDRASMGALVDQSHVYVDSHGNTSDRPHFLGVVFPELRQKQIGPIETISLHVEGPTAWIVFEAVLDEKVGDSQTLQRYHIHTVLEKINGEWRYVRSVSTLLYPEEIELSSENQLTY